MEKSDCPVFAGCCLHRGMTRTLAGRPNSLCIRMCRQDRLRHLARLSVQLPLPTALRLQQIAVSWGRSWQARAKLARIDCPLQPGKMWRKSARFSPGSDGGTTATGAEIGQKTDRSLRAETSTRAPGGLEELAVVEIADPARSAISCDGLLTIGGRHRQSLGNRAVGVPVECQAEVSSAHRHARRVISDT